MVQICEEEEDGETVKNYAGMGVERYKSILKWKLYI